MHDTQGANDGIQDGTLDMGRITADESKLKLKLKKDLVKSEAYDHLNQKPGNTQSNADEFDVTPADKTI